MKLDQVNLLGLQKLNYGSPKIRLSVGDSLDTPYSDFSELHLCRHRFKGLVMLDVKYTLAIKFPVGPQFIASLKNENPCAL